MYIAYHSELHYNYRDEVLNVSFYFFLLPIFMKRRAAAQRSDTGQT